MFIFVIYLKGERLDQMRSDFIANASHELRTPLTSISGFIETLQGSARDDSEARDKFLKVMSKQARQMTHLIDDLLSLSHIEMNAYQIPTDRVDIVATVQMVVDTLTGMAEAQNISILIEPHDSDLGVIGVQEEIIQVFQNLIQNAIKYGRSDGEVRVRFKKIPASRSQGARIAVEIADNGIGIAAQHLPRLTERFYRVDVARSKAKGGTGLGLAIAKHIINHHRGELKIESTPKKGSQFTVLLPSE